MNLLLCPAQAIHFLFLHRLSAGRSEILSRETFERAQKKVTVWIPDGLAQILGWFPVEAARKKNSDQPLIVKPL